MSARDFIRVGAYRAFYDLIACALETHNPERAANRVIEARGYMEPQEIKKLVAELESEYYQFT